jgi:hypothetical protein
MRGQLLPVLRGYFANGVTATVRARGFIPPSLDATCLSIRLTAVVVAIGWLVIPPGGLLGEHDHKNVQRWLGALEAMGCVSLIDAGTQGTHHGGKASVRAWHPTPKPGSTKWNSNKKKSQARVQAVNSNAPLPGTADPSELWDKDSYCRALVAPADDTRRDQSRTFLPRSSWPYRLPRRHEATAFPQRIHDTTSLASRPGSLISAITKMTECDLPDGVLFGRLHDRDLHDIIRDAQIVSGVDSRTGEVAVRAERSSTQRHIPCAHRPASVTGSPGELRCQL